MNILVIVAHPDDPEFFCGGTIAKWTSEGHDVRYVILTGGEKGTDRDDMTTARLVMLRCDEQRAAAAVLGVRDVTFLTHIDGEMANTLDTRRDITREIRRAKPNIIITTDPLTLHYGAVRVNHNDHRIAGMAVCDAVFPASANRMYFPELLAEGFVPHAPREIYFAGAAEPDTLVDVSPFIEQKVAAILQHVTQVKEPDALGARIRQGALRMRPDGSFYFAEAFRRVLM